MGIDKRIFIALRRTVYLDSTTHSANAVMEAFNSLISLIISSFIDIKIG